MIYNFYLHIQKILASAMVRQNVAQTMFVSALKGIGYSATEVHLNACGVKMIVLEIRIAQSTQPRAQSMMQAVI